MRRIFTTLHKHPELSNDEYWTTEQIKGELTALDIPIKDYGLETGVVAEVTGNPDGPIIALRADIDALPLQEESQLPYQSQIEGVHHACGHDFHTAALLGAARLLRQQRDQLPGTVRLLFEPGEERHTGAKTMLKAGALNGVAAIFGMHNMPQIPVGEVGVKVGKLMASNDNFEVTINGAGSHAAMPHTGRDPLVATAAIIMSLQTIVSRNIDPADRVVVTVGQITGGHANNVIPDDCFFKGTIRAFSDESRALAKERFNEVVSKTALAYGQTATITWDQGPSPVDNEATVTKLVAEQAQQFMTVIDPAMTNADDDFASFEEQVPGCYAFMGSQGQSNLHHSDFIANPDGLKYAAKLHERVAIALLKRAAIGENL
ncbi:amidohydrolase [Lactobacillus sp. LC28-10]|uniref:Amidohydrolase n=2 Tax=Secundilactobacillus angelensis TaxID=2722706 RepID=A0ABX1KZW7_9LACO|nr:amidohydrolase [Secundilactobacillus angelensis]